jgi:hypothetical protein
MPRYLGVARNDPRDGAPAALAGARPEKAKTQRCKDARRVCWWHRHCARFQDDPGDRSPARVLCIFASLRLNPLCSTVLAGATGSQQPTRQAPIFNRKDVKDHQGRVLADRPRGYAEKRWMSAMPILPELSPCNPRGVCAFGFSGRRSTGVARAPSRARKPKYRGINGCRHKSQHSRPSRRRAEKRLDGAVRHLCFDALVRGIAT